MKNKLIIILGALLLLLPAVIAQVSVQLGEPYVNVESFSDIKFKSHSNYYEFCSLDETIIPVVVGNNNDYADMFTFTVDKDYVSMPVSSTVLGKGKSAILPLILSPPIDIEENTSVILDIVTKREGLKRSLVIKTNIQKCYGFDLVIDKENEEICGCDEAVYSVILTNNGKFDDVFNLDFDVPEWVDLTLINSSIKLSDGQKKEIKLLANPGCEEKGVFNIDIEAVSEKSNVVLKDSLELKVLSQKECYNTVMDAPDVSIDYFGRNIPITLKNKGAKEMSYSLSAEGVLWYSLSQANFSLDSGGEKTINLALSPDESVAPGDYTIDLKARTAGGEFTESILVKLRRKGVVLGKFGFYLNYFRYYIVLGFVLLVVILLLSVLIKKRMKGRSKIEKAVKGAKIDRGDEKKVSEKGVVEKKESKKVSEKKIENKGIVKKTIWIKPRIKWLLSFAVYIIFLGLLVYSTFRYRSYYEKALNFISGLFVKYIVPYGHYLKYAVLGLGIIGVVILTVNFYRKGAKKKEDLKKEKKVDEKAEKKAENKVENKDEGMAVTKKVEKKESNKVSEKNVENKVVDTRKLKLFEYVYLILVALLFLSVIVYSIYKFFGGKFAMLMVYAGYVKSYVLYLIIGVVVLALAIFIINIIKKKGNEKKGNGKSVKKPKKVSEKKDAKKLSKNTKKSIKNAAIIILGLIILSGIVYSFIYFNLVNHIKDFFVVYYPYILMGIGILVIMVLILNFYSKKIS